MTEIEWLQNWCRQQSNGIWEHASGVGINTVDNPGWSVKIELKNTQFENRRMDKISIDQGEDNWITCWVADSSFFGYGDLSKLEGIVGVFRRWIEQPVP